VRRLSTIAVPVMTLVLGSLLSACDTGDGTTLQEPVAPTTTAPIDTAPLPSLPLTDAVLPGSDDPTSTVDVANDTEVDDAESGDIEFDDITDVDTFSVIAPWTDGDPLNPTHTCDGAGVAPDIAWTGVPDGTAELALSLVDESNLIDGQPFVHWVVAGIDPAVGQLVPDDFPPGAFEAINSSGDVGYSTPCPDPGTTGVYVLRLFAAGQQVEAFFETPAAEVLDNIEAVSFGVASLSGTVTR
jgi:phosphatidylethanolamine-binding protein (PEBP) family uncharacterized protein